MESRFYHSLWVHRMVRLKWSEIKSPTWDQGEYVPPSGRDAAIDLEDRGMWHSATDTEIRDFVSKYRATRIRVPLGSRIIVLLKRDEDNNDRGVLQIRQSMQPNEVNQAERYLMAGEIIRSSNVAIGMLSFAIHRLYGKLRLGPGAFR